MTNNSGAELRAESHKIDKAVLTPLVRQALGSDMVEISGWRTQQVHGGVGAGSAGGSAVHRVSGRGKDQGQAVEWSLILKVLDPPADRGEPSDWDYWRREADAYESGLLDDLPGGLAAPRCFGVVDQPDGECWIWMEDVEDDIGPEWPLEHYGTAARHLGQFNGAYLTGERPVPPWPWLRRWSSLRSSFARPARSRAELTSALDHPLVRRAYPREFVDASFCAWGESERFFDALDRLPQTLCHGDAFRRNLFARRTLEGHDQTVAIDWAVVGIAWIGREITKLVDNALGFGEMDYSEAKELDHIAFGGYLDGLKDAGWDGDWRQARFGQIGGMSGVLPVVHASGALAVLLDESQHARAEELLGLPIEGVADCLAGRSRSHLDHLEEARELLGEL